MKDQNTLLEASCQQKQSWKYHFDDSFFESVDNEASAYWLGFLYADGGVYTDGKQIHSVTIKLASKDESHLMKLQEALHSNHKLQRRTRLSRFPNGNEKWLTCSMLRITSVKLFHDLVKLGCVPAKSLILTFPWQHVSEQLVHHFIRGYFDGDGSVSISGRQKQFSLLGTESFLKDVQKILMTECGLSQTKIHRKNSIFCLHYGGNLNINKIKKFFYQGATIFLERKKSIFDVEFTPCKRSGSANPAYDSSRYTFKNKITLEEFFGTQYEFKAKYNLPDASRLIHKRRRTYKGWYLLSD